MLQQMAKIATIILAALFAIPAEAQLDHRALNGALRSHVVEIPHFYFGQINDPDRTSTSSTPAALHVSGVNGIVFATTLSFSSTVGVSGGCPRNDGASCTSSIGAVPYPAKLVIQLLDNSAGANTLECGNTADGSAGEYKTRARIFGLNQFGQAVSERIPALTEAARYETIHAYEKVTRVDVTRCSGGGGSGTGADQFIIATSNAIAMPFKMNVTTSQMPSVVSSVCRHRASVNHRCVVPASSRFAGSQQALGSDIIEYDRVAHTLSVTDLVFPGSNGAISADRLIFFTRAPTTGF